MNTGSPEAPEEAAVRVYLKEFLMDPHVIDLPWPLRAMLVHGLILPRRPAESAKAYATIWTENGSPLVHYCTELANGLNVEVGMAYGKPSFKDAVEKLLADGVDEVCLLPMFPHYAMATTGSCTAGVKAAIKGRASLRVAPPFFDEPTFIQPLAESLAEVGEHILFTFHGLPERHLRKDARTADYRINCMETARLIAAAAGIPEERYTVSFQSRLGRAKWLEPYTEETLRQLPAAGKNRLAVICPSFFCDCLETLEEIEIRGKEAFLEAGGESFRMIPCLNHSPAAFHCLETLMANAGNWNEA
jgi:ferrochelatase